MVKRKKSLTEKVKVQEATPETLRIEIDQVFKEFLANPDVNEHIFTSDLNNLQRKYIHEKAQQLNLQSKSYGKEPDRKLHIKKRKKPIKMQSFFLNCSEGTNVALHHFMNVKNSTNTSQNPSRKFDVSDKVFGKLVDGPPSKVSAPKLHNTDIIKFKKNLPIYPKKQQIIESIRHNQVVIISSETGSGKTTQIPQYILEDMRVRQQNCKIICTQPRRISTVAVSERVAEELGETIGSTVGYHIRLEQKYGVNTNLIYCTNGVMLRTLMNGLKALCNVTHIIIDEVHERDRLSDFLLICLKRSLQLFPDLRVILMSATVNVDKFRSYFGNDAEVLTVPGRMFSITEYYLDDILEQLSYVTPAMLQLKHKNTPAAAVAVVAEPKHLPVHQVLDMSLQDYMTGDGNFMECTAYYFISEEVSVDYQHSGSGLTALMIASVRGDTDSIGRLCKLGANLYLRCRHGRNCFDYAIINKQFAALQLLNYIRNSTEMVEPPTSDLLELYDKTQPEGDIDFDLIVHTICAIHNNTEPGSILVFLPGYDEIMQVADKIADSSLNPSTYRTFFLHGSMNIKEQHEVFKHLPNERKIILSTNIAETSITIDDVVFVIDSGRAKEKKYDAYNKLSSLEMQWISKACAKQRAGRAGRTRPGKCFHIFSRQRYVNLDEERTPEMLRVSLEELCLHTKLLAPSNMRIHEFLSYAPDPPMLDTVNSAIESLIALGALDENENLTQLGEYLSQFTLEPRLGKILLYSVIFRCLEPILTLTAVMAHKDPFQLPPQANLRTAAAERRKALTDGVPSDHVIYLYAFKKWQDECYAGRNNEFCDKYFISRSTMDTILTTRRQLLGQLRAAGFVPQSHSIEDLNVNAKCWPVVKGVMCSGLYPNIAYPIRGNMLATRNEKKVFPSNTSVLSKYIPTWVMYDELMKNRQNFCIRGITAITPMTVALIGGIKLNQSDDNNFIIDDWLDIEVSNASLLHLKLAINSLIEKVLANPLVPYNNLEKTVVNTLCIILSEEDVVAGLPQAKGIGGRPKFFYKMENCNNQNLNFRQEVVGLVKNGRRGQMSNTRRGRAITQNFSTQLLEETVQRMNILGDALDIASVDQTNLNDKYPENPIYILIKPKQLSSVQIAYNTSKWVFSPQTEKRILKFDNLKKGIYLIFTATDTETFNGMAKFHKFCESSKGKPYAVLEWLFPFDIGYHAVKHLRNKYNDHRFLYEGPDGQVVEPEAACQLMTIYKNWKTMPESGAPVF